MLVFPNYKTNPIQSNAIKNANARLNIFDGSIRSGKTVGSIFWFVLKAFENPNEKGLYLICGKTLDSIERNILIPMEQWLPRENFSYAKAARYAVLEDKNNNIKIKIFLVGAKDISSASVIKGSTIYLALCDELTEIPENFFIMLDRGLSLKNSTLLGTTNPDSPRHWLKVNYIDRRNEIDLSYQKFTIFDNPYLNKEVIKKLEQNFTGLWKKRYILGEWVSASGAIYGDSFNVDTHVINCNYFIEKCVEYYVGIDYGIKNPCVFLLFGKDVNGTFYLFKEYYWDSSIPECPKQKGVNEYLIDLKDFINTNLPNKKKLKSIFIDPSALDFILLINKDKDIQAHAMVAKEGIVSKAKNSVISGIQLVIDKFNKNKLFIDRMATNTIQELITYSWDERVKTEDKPKKQNDHACDVLRYVIASTQLRQQGNFLLNPKRNAARRY